MPDPTPTSATAMPNIIYGAPPLSAESHEPRFTYFYGPPQQINSFKEAVMRFPFVAKDGYPVREWTLSDISAPNPSVPGDYLNMADLISTRFQQPFHEDWKLLRLPSLRFHHDTTPLTVPAYIKALGCRGKAAKKIEAECPDLRGEWLPEIATRVYVLPEKEWNYTTIMQQFRHMLDILRDNDPVVFGIVTLMEPPRSQAWPSGSPEPEDARLRVLLQLLRDLLARTQPKD